MEPHPLQQGKPAIMMSVLPVSEAPQTLPKCNLLLLRYHSFSYMRGHLCLLSFGPADLFLPLSAPSVKRNCLEYVCQGGCHRWRR